MDDDDTLKLFSEMVENLKETTEKFPCGFSMVFSTFVSDLNKFSMHINNNNLRKCFFHLYVLTEPFYERYNTILRIKIYEELKELLKEEELDEGLKEIVFSASQDITIKVFADNDARDIIDIMQLKEEMDNVLETLDESTKILVFSEITNSIRKVYDGFVKESSKEIIEFYDKLIESSKNNWESVNIVILDCLIESDNKAILWRRGET